MSAAVAAVRDYAHVSSAAYDRFYCLSVSLLVNEHCVLNAGLTIVGTEDSVTKHYDLHSALRGLPATPVRLHLIMTPSERSSKCSDGPTPPLPVPSPVGEKEPTA